MAKFKEKHLKLKDNQHVYFGDFDESSLWFDGSGMRIATTISGVDPTSDDHLATKKYVDDHLASQDDHNELNGLDYASAGHTGFASSDDLTTLSGNLQTNIDGKSDTSHTHTESDIIDLDYPTTLSGLNDTPSVYDNGKYLRSTASGTEWSAIAGNHSALTELDYASSGHTGFASSDDLTTLSGNLSQEIDDDIATFSGTIDHDTLVNYSADEHFTEANISHLNIQNIGSTTHSGIDVHIAGADKHREINDSASGVTDLWSAEKIEDRVVTATGTLTTDHGELDGLADDDHTQYHTDARGDARYYTETEADALHTTLSGNLQSNIDGKSDLGHDHTESDITDLDKYTQAEVDSLITTISGKLDDHNELNNLDYASSGHTGFAQEGHAHDDLYYTETELDSGQLDNRYYTETEADALHTTLSGNLQTNIDGKIANVVEDTTPQLGGDLDTNQKNIELQSVPTSDHEANGIIATMTVDANATGFGAALHMDTDEHWIEADANSADTMPCQALALVSGTGSKKVLLRGFIRDDSWDWTVGDTIYVSTTAGGLTQTTVSGDGDQAQAVGYATHADRMFFNPTLVTVEAGVVTWTESDIIDLDKYTQAEVDSLLTTLSGNLSDEIDSDIATFSGTIDHDTIQNTHNLTTDIDHNQLTNYSAAEHFTETSISHLNIQDIGSTTHSGIDVHIADVDKHREINDSASAATDLWSAEKIQSEIATISGMLDDHNELNNIQGGAPDDYYHLTNTQHTDLTDGGDCSVHKHDDLYYTETELDGGQLDNRYYTETEVDALWATWSGTIDHNTIINTHNLTTDIDHGAISGLDDDDHSQYIPTDASRGFTATVSGVDPTEDYHLATKVYVDENSEDKRKTGREALSLNDSGKAVTFGTAFADTDYSLSVMMKNTIDSPPSIYPMIVTTTTVSGFSVLFSGDIDSDNYYLDWIAQHD